MGDEQHRSAGGEIEIKEERYYSIEMTATDWTRPPSPPEPDVAPTAGSTIMDLVKQKLRSVKGKLSGTFIFSMARRPTRVQNRDLVATTDRSIFEITGGIASALTGAFQIFPMTNNNHHPQDNNHNQQAIDGIDLLVEYPQVPHVDPIVMFTGVSPVHVTYALWLMALITLILDIAIAVSKPAARGVVFESNKYAYYITLGVIFVFGVIEAFTAFWMSRTRDPQRRRFRFGTVVLCASIMPFVAIAALYLAHIAN